MTKMPWCPGPESNLPFRCPFSICKVTPTGRKVLMVKHWTNSSKSCRTVNSVLPVSMSGRLHIHFKIIEHGGELILNQRF